MTIHDVSPRSSTIHTFSRVCVYMHKCHVGRALLYGSSSSDSTCSQDLCGGLYSMSVCVVHETGKQKKTHSPIMPSLASFFGLPMHCWWKPCITTDYHETFAKRPHSSRLMLLVRLRQLAATCGNLRYHSHTTSSTSWAGRTWNSIFRLSQSLAGFVAQDSLPSLTEKASTYEVLLSTTCAAW